jgi:shikimate kinase
METKNLLFICGFMACGKTTHGKQLAKNIGYHFIDLDDYTENKFDKHITELFKDLGEEEFRKIETASLNECIRDNQKTVIALGGGTPCFNANLELIKASGKLVYLKMDAEDLYRRVFGIKTQRPLLATKEDKDMLEYIQNLLNVRESFYSQADLTVYNNNLQEEELKASVLNFMKH